MGKQKIIMQQQQINGSYQELEPKVDAYSKEETLTDFTRNVLGLPLESVPDDAFLALTIGTDSVAYRVKVVYPNGKPAVGFTVSGIDPLPTTTLITDSNGIVLGKSTKSSVNITIAKKYDDVKEYSGSFNSVGTLTNCNIVLEWDETVINVTSSKTITPVLSSFVSKVEWVVVGGGGGAPFNNNVASARDGRGGGGYAAHGVTDFENGNSITFTIGAGGKNRPLSDGGESSITIRTFSKKVLGGKQGGSCSEKRSSVNSNTRYTGTAGIGGEGNGNGATGASQIYIEYYNPDDDKDNECYTESLTSAGAAPTRGEQFQLKNVVIRTGGGGGTDGVPYYQTASTRPSSVYGTHLSATSDVGQGASSTYNAKGAMSGGGWYYFPHN